MAKVPGLTLEELPPAPRDEVAWFATVMEQKLRENEHKTGWSTDSLRALMRRLDQEANELERRLDGGSGGSPAEIIREAADVANFAMMIADMARHVARSA